MSEGIAGVPPAVPGAFTLPPYDLEPPVLLGGICIRCGRSFFPRPRYCPRCMEPVEQARVGEKGRIYSFTVVRTKAPLGLPEPYAVGYVDLEGSGLRIFCLLDPAAIPRLKLGLPVRLKVSPMGHDGRGSPRLRPYFTPEED